MLPALALLASLAPTRTTSQAAAADAPPTYELRQEQTFPSPEPAPVENWIEIDVPPAAGDVATAVPAAADATPAAADPAPAAPAVAASLAHAEQVAHAAAADDDIEIGDLASDDALELELDERPTSFPDPFESMNRRTLSLNQTVDRWVVEPVADAYGYVMPARAKQSVRDFLANLESPAIFVNDVLQGEIGNAAITVARFSVNTVFGIAGLFDPASGIGLERHDADFGQTLARNGVGSGPFLIVPLLGPTTVRDGVGTLVDIALQPTIYLLGPTPLVVASVQEGTVGLTLREKHGDDLERLEQASLDYYAALRSAYYQDRMAQLGEAGPPVLDDVASAHPTDDVAPTTEEAAAVASALPGEEPAAVATVTPVPPT